MKPIWRLYNHQGPDWQYAQALIKEPNDAVSLLCVYVYQINKTRQILTFYFLSDFDRR